MNDNIGIGIQCDIHSICRICLEYLRNEHSYDLFMIPGLAKKLCVCTSLSVEQQDGFPKNICGICYTRLNDLHEFQKLCVDSVQKFQEMLSNNMVTVMESASFVMPSSNVLGDEEEPHHTGIDDDDRLNFDPLLNHKMELIENEEDVFKLLENVDKDVLETEIKEEQRATNATTKRTAAASTYATKKIFSDSDDDDDGGMGGFDDDDDEDFQPPPPPVKKRVRRRVTTVTTNNNNNSSVEIPKEEKATPDAPISEGADNADDNNSSSDDDDSELSEEGSDDDKPLAQRLRNSLRQKRRKTGGEDDDYFEGVLDDGTILKNRDKPKRRRIPAAERHLHRIIDCHICHKKFKKAERYQEHMKYHNDKLPHQCTHDTCRRGFTTANGLRLHVEHCHAESLETLPCPEEGCGRRFPRVRLLNWHLKKVHKIVKELNEPKCYPCSECEKIFRCPMALKKHMYKHDGKELPFPCNICGKRFVINSALKDHLMRHAGIKNYVCPYCGVGKTTRQEWNTHINTHTQEKQFKCSLCPHASHNKQNLRMHVKIVHEKIKDYACQYCGKTFGKSNACKMHEMTHTGEKRCECKVCGKKFLYAKGLTKHLKTHEKRVLRAIEVYRKRTKKTGATGEGDAADGTEGGDGSGQQMDDNDEPLPQLPKSDSHSNESHQMVAEEILKVCAESAKTIPKDPRRVARVDISELAGTAVNPIPSVAVPSWSPQINFMMKEGPYICPDCGQGFNGPGNLKRHHRIVHEGVKDFACRFCHRRFAKAQTLKHHEMTHTGEKPHVCPDCGRRFIQYVALKRHLKVHANKPAGLLPANEFAATEQLHKQERKRQEAKRKAEAKRAAIAEKAKEQLDVIQQQEDEVRQLQRELLVEAIPVPDPRILRGGPIPKPVVYQSDDVFVAKEELQVQAMEKIEAQRLADVERAVIAEQAKEQLEKIQAEEAEIRRRNRELTVDAPLVPDPRIGDFQHVNTSTMGVRTQGVRDP